MCVLGPSCLMDRWTDGPEADHQQAPVTRLTIPGCPRSQSVRSIRMKGAGPFRADQVKVRGEVHRARLHWFPDYVVKIRRCDDHRAHVIFSDSYHVADAVALRDGYQYVGLPFVDEGDWLRAASVHAGASLGQAAHGVLTGCDQDSRS